MVMGEMEWCVGGVTAFKKCDSPHGGVKDIRKVCLFYGEF